MKIDKAEARKTGIQLLKYGVIGVMNTLITLVSFYLLNTRLGVPYGPSNIIGYVLGVINSFLWNRNWVFKTGVNVRREACGELGAARRRRLEITTQRYNPVLPHGESWPKYCDGHFDGSLHGSKLRLQPLRHI